MSSIYGGFEEILYTSSAIGGAETATPVAITTRLNPILDPSNINIRGTGKRGLYDILLGMRQIQFNIDILPSAMSFIADYQDGQTEIPYLHYKNVRTNTGLTFLNVVFNRVSVESRHNAAIQATIEMWADDLTALATMGTWTALSDVVTPYRWLYSALSIDSVPELEWWSWRYEVNNNLQRLGDVQTGGIRAIKARHRDVSGLIVKDLASFAEWTDLMVVAPGAEEAKFPIVITITGEDGPGSGATINILDQAACRWGRIEGPTGPEDLQAKRFPFTAIDLT